jgi:NAD(P)-dependent dehydrogenase (short-subunit alcohol dehydrogenase family)
MMSEQTTALVTGGSRGIGAAIARTLAAAGHRVLVNYRANEDAAAKVVEEITAAARVRAMAAPIPRLPPVTSAGVCSAIILVPRRWGGTR